MRSGKFYSRKEWHLKQLKEVSIKLRVRLLQEIRRRAHGAEIAQGSLYN